MPEGEEAVHEVDSGLANTEHKSIVDLNKSSISNAASANKFHNDKKSRIGKKTKRSKQRPTHGMNSNDNKSREKPTPTSSTQISRRKRSGRLVRRALIKTKKNDRDSEASTIAGIPRTTSVPPLPRNQYVTTLRRRAIRKPTSGTPHNDEECGDISLGMKLIVAGGRVIVQSLNSLNDGLASPAQLAGVIQRGDVLLAIGNLSLANLPVNELMEGLRPLSTPDSGGFYERCLDLRFEAGAGLGLLTLHEQEHARSEVNLTADGMFPIFPMVDQLSGAPLFDPPYSIDAKRDKLRIEADEDEDAAHVMEEMKDNFPGNDQVLSERKTIDEVIDKFSWNFDSLISAALAKERNSDRDRYESEYFDLREGISALLRTTMSMGERQKNGGGKRLTKKERLEVGRKIMKITKALELNLEEIDKGSDGRSQNNWNSSLSIRSGSSTIAKRQYNMDGTITSFHSIYENPLDDSVDEESVGFDGSIDGVDSDKLLVGLAARDEIWRKLVTTMLDKAADDIKNSGEKTGEEKSNGSSSPNGAVDLKQQLGYFLFRENTPRIRKLEIKSSAFPPQEITRILFNLATFIATSAQDDITVFGGSSKISSNISSRRSVATKSGARGRLGRGDMLLAKRFILDEALPHWLKSFQPFKLDQRMVLWPSHTNRTGSMQGTNSIQRRTKSSEETGNYATVDNDLKSETCFLVTYYCTEKIIGSNRQGEFNAMNKNPFILTYGAYLQIQTCLSFASFVKDMAAISELLEVANDDPNHVDAMEDIQTSKNELLYYDSMKLSAVLKSLEDIRFETNEGRTKVLLDLCVGGYPDIQPWLVRTACLSPPQPGSNEKRNHCSNDTMEEIYYTYLSRLLHPVDGHEAAREDLDLLKEFCEWSIGIDSRTETKPMGINNFIIIAAPSSEHRNSYRRDLVMLLDMSLVTENHNLSLDLVNEIIGNGKLSSNKEALHRALYCLRRIGTVSITLCSSASTEHTGFDALRRVLILFEKMSTKQSLLRPNSMSIPGEIFALFKQWKIEKGSTGDDVNMYRLIDFVIETSSVPADVVRALFLWSSDINGDSLFPRLEDLLRRGINFAVLNGDFSGALLRLKNARTSFKELDSTLDHAVESKESGSIWESMGEGILQIEK